MNVMNLIHSNQMMLDAQRVNIADLQAKTKTLQGYAQNQNKSYEELKAQQANLKEKIDQLGASLKDLNSMTSTVPELQAQILDFQNQIDELHFYEQLISTILQNKYGLNGLS